MLAVLPFVPSEYFSCLFRISSSQFSSSEILLKQVFMTILALSFKFIKFYPKQAKTFLVSTSILLESQFCCSTLSSRQLAITLTLTQRSPIFLERQLVSSESPLFLPFKADQVITIYNYFIFFSFDQSSRVLLSNFTWSYRTQFEYSLRFKLYELYNSRILSLNVRLRSVRYQGSFSLFVVRTSGSAMRLTWRETNLPLLQMHSAPRFFSIVSGYLWRTLGKGVWFWHVRVNFFCEGARDCQCWKVRGGWGRVLEWVRV